MRDNRRWTDGPPVFVAMIPIYLAILAVGFVAGSVVKHLG